MVITLSVILFVAGIALLTYLMESDNKDAPTIIGLGMFVLVLVVICFITSLGFNLEDHPTYTIPTVLLNYCFCLVETASLAVAFVPVFTVAGKLGGLSLILVFLLFCGHVFVTYPRRFSGAALQFTGLVVPILTTFIHTGMREWGETLLVLLVQSGLVMGIGVVAGGLFGGGILYRRRPRNFRLFFGLYLGSLMLLYMVFICLPMVWGFVGSFHDYKALVTGDKNAPWTLMFTLGLIANIFAGLYSGWLFAKPLLTAPMAGSSTKEQEEL